jgi:hypothetical protein
LPFLAFFFIFSANSAFVGGYRGPDPPKRARLVLKRKVVIPDSAGLAVFEIA